MRRAARRVRKVGCPTAAARHQYRGRPIRTRLCLLAAAAAAPQVLTRWRAALRVAAVVATSSLGIRYRLAWTTGKVACDVRVMAVETGLMVLGCGAWNAETRPQFYLLGRFRVNCHHPHLPARVLTLSALITPLLHTTGAPRATATPQSVPLPRPGMRQRSCDCARRPRRRGACGGGGMRGLAGKRLSLA